jgi:ElaB/YqjD/DUF883 family membrane-anchored ribosome-binding protein
MYQEESDFKSQAGDAADQVKSKAGDTAQQIKSQASDAAGEVKEQAKEVSTKAQGYVSGQVDDRSTQAGQWMRKTGEDMRNAASTLRDKGDDLPAQINEQIGTRMERLGSYMERTHGDQLMNDAQDFARRNVWALAIGGLVLGLAASRMIGASRALQEREDDRSYGQLSIGYPGGQPYDDRISGGSSELSGAGGVPYTGPVAVPYPRQDADSGARYGSG